MEIKNFERLSNNYIGLLEKGNDFNVIINVGDYTDTREFKAHSVILKCRSSYFQDKLENIIEDTDSIIKLDLESQMAALAS
ncbi:hypothetical protein C2G38_2184925 [Gigaspora rosea]|uniref:BTB domain-containing protein n=1 Tax=Gigaspora rosea TaxID=44941 RepID=A0A397V799_9GLOM|nr:hypothetical protein C2G38_2184925 [Gigaspora rosea]